MISIGGQLFKQVGYYFNQIDSIFKTSSESAFTSVLTIPMPIYTSVAAPIQPTYTSVGVG